MPYILPDEMSETMTKYFVTAGIARSKAILFLEGDQKRPN